MRLIFVIDCVDRRNEHIYEMLLGRGYNVTKLSPDNVFSPMVKYIFLFAPSTQLTADMADNVPEDSVIFCANCPSLVRRILEEERDVEVLNYFDDESLAMHNAWLTAEGALAAVIASTDKALSDISVLVLGGGRVGKCAAKILEANGCEVSMATRRKDEYALVPLFAKGAHRFGEIDGIIHGFDVVINTVPAKVLKRERLLALKKNCFVLDLASRPGGVDMDAAGDIGVKVQLFLGVPGKTAPETAARQLLDSVLERVEYLIE